MRLKGVLLAIGFAIAVPLAQAEYIDLPVKWSQPPDMERGLDHRSFHGTVVAPDPVVADDFISVTGDAIVAVRWWGSYLTADGGLPSDYKPPVGFAVPFHISFYSDVPAGQDPTAPWSHPGQLLLEQTVLAQEELYGEVPDPETVFMYNAVLKIPFEQALYHEPGAATVFWIAIDRIDREDWGWHEAITQNIDDAVTGPTHLGPWTPLFKIKDPNVSADMAFELMVPEPTTLALLTLGVVPLLRRRVRRA